MSDFDPGAGWREEKIRSVEELRVGDVVTRADSVEKWPMVRRRKEPVPPLPTEKFTVIKAYFAGGTYEWLVLWIDGCHNVATGRLTIMETVTGFEVLALPRNDWLIAGQVRRETAKAVFRAFEEHNWDTSTATVSKIEREFL